MKDAYSFHTSQESLDEYYNRAHEAYERIFDRVGLKHVVSIQSDTGMMGGAVSHEFMSVADCGEDVLFLSPDGQYKANREVATAAWTYEKEEMLPLEKVHTPGRESIEEVAAFLGVAPSKTCKAVFYAGPDGKLVFVLIRGDFEVNEAKLRKHLRMPEIGFANDAQIRQVGAEPGFASVVGLDLSRIRVVVDPSVAETSNLVAGANEPDYHYRNFNFGRDTAGGDVVDIATVREGDPCPLTGQPLLMRRGIEVGNIFQLGTKYTESMNCRYLDENGKSHVMIMGCYGIGIGRTMAAVIEDSHDDYGPVWPMAIAPFQVHLCALNIKKDEVRTAADKLYADLTAAGIEVLYDDRGEKAGFMFNDADLIGVPLRLIISPKTLENGQVEFKTRDGSRTDMIAFDQAAAFVVCEVRKALA